MRCASASAAKAKSTPCIRCSTYVMCCGCAPPPGSENEVAYSSHPCGPRKPLPDGRGSDWRCGCAHQRRDLWAGSGGVSRQEKAAGPNPVVGFVIGRFFRRLRAVLAELDPHSVLDAGCGEGEMLRRGVLPAAVCPVCLDLRPASLAEIAEPQRVCASVLALPFAAGSFD